MRKERLKGPRTSRPTAHPLRWLRQTCAPALLLVLLCLGATPARAAGPASPADRTRIFLDGVAAYEAGNYDRAVEAFSSLAEAGIRNGVLYFDLGNAYLKAGRLGAAILWYERAALLIPGDADLRYNLEYARGLTRDRGDQTGGDLSRVLLFWRSALGERGMRWAALGLNALAWPLLLLGWMGRRRGLRRAGAATMVAVAILAGTSLFDYYRATSAAEAVILPPEVVVRSGLTDDSTELFRLHAGAQVRIDREEGGRARITFARDKVGWVSEAAVGRIRVETGKE